MEMITVVDRPLIQYAVDEAREAGIEQMIFITGRGKESLVDYFDMSFELEAAMEKSSLTALAREQLKLASQAASGRSADTVYGGQKHILRQTVIALVAGRGLSEHENPGEATVYVLRGRVLLHGEGAEWEGSPGDLLIVPEARHSLEALEDSVVLLTVAKAGA